MAAYVAAHTSKEVLAEFERVDAAIAPVLDMSDIVDDPHYRHRQALVEVDGVLMQNVVARMSRTPGGSATPGVHSVPTTTSPRRTRWHDRRPSVARVFRDGQVCTETRSSDTQHSAMRTILSTSGSRR